MPKLTLPDAVASAADVRQLLLELQTYARWQAHNATKQQFGARATDDGPVVLSAAAHHLLAEQSDVETLIEALKRLADHAETITITLPAPPSGGLKQRMVGWCRQNIAPDTLVNFDFTGTLLGGMVVRRGSHIYDWSFRRQILASQDKLIKVLRRA